MSVDDILFAPIGANTGIKIPDAWIEVLRAIRGQPNWANAALAGGALRDLENGRPIKDVDIFVPYLGENEYCSTRLKQALSGISVSAIPHSVHNGSQVGAEGINHYQFRKDGWLFEVSQVVATFDYMTLLDTFDIGICMVSLDDSYNIYRTPEYKKDVADKSVTIVRNTGGREVEHAGRILEKYTNWTLVQLP